MLVWNYSVTVLVLILQINKMYDVNLQSQIGIDPVLSGVP